MSPRELTGAQLPPQLSDLPEPPSRLYAVGDVPRGPIVAIVGTRTPSEPAIGYARELACSLAASGVVIASGGAEGIDTAAHLGALDARGTTVVVAPSSYDHPFPEENRELFARVVQRGGAYISMFAAGVPARRAHFFQRNAVLAALSVAVIVVESRFRGGARNAAKHARALGRAVFAVPGAPWCPTAAGCLLELRLGAEICSAPRDVLRALARRNAHSVPVEPFGSSADRPASQERLPGLSEPVPSRAAAVRSAGSAASSGSGERARVLEFIGDRRVHPDAICQALSLPAGRVQELLLTLTLEKIVVSDSSSGQVSRVKF